MQTYINPTQRPIKTQIPQYTEAQKQLVEKQLNAAVKGTNQVLATATTVFPFTLFPDTITVDREKLTVTHRLFFGAAEVISIQIEDILNVTTDVGPFFATLKITTRFFDPDKPYAVEYLWRKDAVRMGRIIHGYISAMQKNIDCDAMPVKELAAIFERLGTDMQAA